MSEIHASTPGYGEIKKRFTLVQNLALVGEVIVSGMQELWGHKLRSFLTLTLLMLGVFALVVMTSALDGLIDKTRTGFSSMGWDGTIVLAPRKPASKEETNRFAMSPGLRYEDLTRIALPHPQVTAYIPYTMAPTSIFINGKEEQVYITGTTADYFPILNRQIASGRPLTEKDQQRRSLVAVVGAALGGKLFNGADPVGRDVIVEGLSFRIVGMYAPKMLMTDKDTADTNGFTIPIETYMDRLDPDHSLEQIIVKLKRMSAMKEVSSLVLSRARQAHHGIEDVKIWDMGKELVKVNKELDKIVKGWRFVLNCLAGTVLLVGGVGILSVMLISFSDRRFEIGLRKSLGATDGQIFVQFLLEAIVLASLGAFSGTMAASFACTTLGHKFPYGLPLNVYGLLLGWIIALMLALIFGLYPAYRAKALSPMEAMR